MADYTIKNLKALEDSAVAGGFSPQLEARFAKGPLECTQCGLSYQRLAPGFRGFGHSHHTQEEVYVVLSGGGRVKLPDGVHELRQWDAVRNETNDTVRVLMFSNVIHPGATVYPDSDKIGVWTGNKADDLLVRRASGVEYYDGEV